PRRRRAIQAIRQDCHRAPAHSQGRSHGRLIDPARAPGDNLYPLGSTTLCDPRGEGQALLVNVARAHNRQPASSETSHVANPVKQRGGCGTEVTQKPFRITLLSAADYPESETLPALQGGSHLHAPVEQSPEAALFRQSRLIRRQRGIGRLKQISRAPS